jgi:hypothetical protein
MNFATVIKTIAAAAVATAFTAGAAAAAPVELITNGSFETLNGGHVLANGTWDTFNNILGWETVQPHGNGIEVRNNVAGTAYAGVNFVELDTNANSAMQQVITGTNAGQHYTLSFAFADRAGVPTSSQGIQVFWGSQDLGVFNNSTGWTVKNLDVTGVQGEVKLKFVAVGTSDSLGTSLDAVSLTSAVPEPETYAMLLAGLGLVGLMKRRKAAK